jgi:hypothetical protein
MQERWFAMITVLTATLALVASLAINSAYAETCSGELEGDYSGTAYGLGGCGLLPEDAKKVLKICAIGQQCEVTGTLEHCKSVKGACANITHITNIRWGKPLPLCTPFAAADRADQWWNGGGSVIVRGTIAESPARQSKPYGHMEIIMDLPTCSNGAPMAVVRVPEGFMGHYVELGGDPMKDGNNWYITARSVKDVSRGGNTTDKGNPDLPAHR